MVILASVIEVTETIVMFASLDVYEALKSTPAFILSYNAQAKLKILCELKGVNLFAF